MRQARTGAAAPNTMPAPPMEPVRVVVEPITVRVFEAVRMTGISRSRLYELIGEGDIEVVKVGASTLVLVASLRSFIDARRATSSRSYGP